MLAETIYVDDTLFTGTKETIDWFYNIVQEKFTITDLGKLKKHLGISVAGRSRDIYHFPLV